MNKKIMKTVSKQDPRFPDPDNTSDISFLEEAELIDFAASVSN